MKKNEHILQIICQENENSKKETKTSYSSSTNSNRVDYLSSTSSTVVCPKCSKLNLKDTIRCYNCDMYLIEPKRKTQTCKYCNEDNYIDRYKPYICKKCFKKLDEEEDVYSKNSSNVYNTNSTNVNIMNNLLKCPKCSHTNLADKDYCFKCSYDLRSFKRSMSKDSESRGTRESKEIKTNNYSNDTKTSSQNNLSNLNNPSCPLCNKKPGTNTSCRYCRNEEVYSNKPSSNNYNPISNVTNSSTLSRDIEILKPDRKSTRLNSSHSRRSRMPSSA